MREKKEIAFKDILSAILKENGLTQTQVAGAIGVKQSQVSEWLKGKAKPGYDTLRSILFAFEDLSAEYLLGLEE